jgi:Flp pilus assembly CpaE family ATPase
LPSRIGDGVAAAVKACDSIALIVDREASSVRMAVEVLEQIKAVGSEEGRVRLVAVDRTKLEVPVPLTDIFTQLKMHPVFVVPHAVSSIACSHSAKTPLAWLNPEDRFSLAALELMEQLIPSAPGFPAKVNTQKSTLKYGNSGSMIPSLYLG